ncbi:hypothetical protein [Lactiplantibacillus carotarum]|uniref:hypothetical protein n=1 Tax=Lactiplantibacillus carotarum TaxID=2993456 RepID=UPI00298ED9E0|nr:hypothetical protein [Lactiplantibacillus carotarum]
MDKDLILATLLQLDDPFYLNTFANAADEDEWFRLNEHYIQTDLQKYFPASIDTRDTATWRYIKSQLRQFDVESE